MEVKCQDTKLKMPREQAYKVVIETTSKDGTIKKTNKYYSSKEAYEKIQHEADMCKACSDFMFFTILGYESGHDMNTSFYKRMQKWHKVYSYEVILKTMELMYDKGHEFVERTISFNSETQRIVYWGSAIENNLEDTYKTMKRKKRQEMLVIDEPEMLNADITPYLQPKKTNAKNLAGDLD